MADFNKEFEKLLKVEGGYVNDKDDTGGETYLGISRRNNPKWSGWSIIDNIKKQYGTKNITNRLKKDESLNNAAKKLYKERYWDAMDLDDVPNQSISHQLFDTCVNCGAKIAITLAQKILSMTPNGKWTDALKHNLMNYGKDK